MKTTMKNVVAGSLALAVGMIFCGFVSADAISSKSTNETVKNFSGQPDGIDSTTNCTTNPSSGGGQVGNDGIVPPEIMKALARSDGTDGGVLATGSAESLASSYDPTSNTSPPSEGNNDGYRNPTEVPTSGGDDGGGGTSTTPEPATLLMMGLGMAALLPAARRYRRK